MINTYQTSVAPPPVPPRHSRPHSYLIPAPLPSPGNSKVLIRFLVGVVLLQLLLTIGGFIYIHLSNNGKMEKGKYAVAEGKASYRSSDKQETSYKTLARMVVEQEHTELKSAAGYLQWNMNHSFQRGINYFKKSWLTVLQPGDYYVYARVTFSKGNSKIPLASKVKLKKNNIEEEKTVMQAFCNLDSHGDSASAPSLCTASQGEVITLEKDDKLSVWVQDLSLVNYEEGATTFGMYKL